MRNLTKVQEFFITHIRFKVDEEEYSISKRELMKSFKNFIPTVYPYKGKYIWDNNVMMFKRDQMWYVVWDLNDMKGYVAEVKLNGVVYNPTYYKLYFTINSGREILLCTKNLI